MGSTMNGMRAPQARLVQPCPASRGVDYKLKTPGAGLMFQTQHLLFVISFLAVNN